jgi:hypothetical protein
MIGMRILFWACSRRRLMVERLREERGVTVCETAVWKLLNRHGQTHKKRPPLGGSLECIEGSRSGLPDMRLELGEGVFDWI